MAKQIKGAGVGECAPLWYQPAPLAYYYPVPAAIFLVAKLVGTNHSYFLQSLLESDTETTDYLQSVLDLNPDYRGNCLANIAYFVAHKEAQHD